MTIGRKLSSLRAFFRLAVRRRLGEVAARSRRCAAPKRAKRLPLFLGKEDVGRLLDGDGPRPDAGPDQLALERALFEVIYGAGLRVSEACGLDVGDIEVDGGARLRARAARARGARIGSCRSARKARAALETCVGAADASAGRRGDGSGRTAGAALFVSRAACAWGRARCAGCSPVASS